MAPYNNAPESGTRNGRPATGRGAGAGAPVGDALFVVLVALCALVISYNGIFRLAEYGGHEGGLLAHVFPVTYTLLLVMACCVSYALRGAHPRERFWVDLVMIPLLILFAVAAMLLNNFGLIERMHQGVANVIVAVAPLAALLVAFLLWLVLRAHVRRRRRRPAARPRPADDPTTVMRARAAAPPSREGAPAAEGEDGSEDLGTRLLRLGAHDGDEATGEDTAGADADGRDWDWERDRWDEEAAAEPPTAEGDPRPDAAREPEEREEDGEPESSAPASALPRRSGNGDNPIRRAAEQVPVVPGAAAPTGSASTAPASEPTAAAADRPLDEGFVHEPPLGDPASDEADAPPSAAPEPRPEPEPAPAPGHGPGSDTGRVPGPGHADGPEARARTEPLPDDAGARETGPEEPGDPDPLPAAEAGTGAADDREHGAPSGTPAEPGGGEPTASWEPPEDDSGTGERVLADYVPPVWTPPEDDAPPLEEEYREPEPALDHDTGPDVRAAFRIDDVPPGAARPSDEPAGPAPGHGEETARDRDGDGEERGDRAEAAAPEPEAGDEPLPEAEELPSAGEGEDGRDPEHAPGEAPRPERSGTRSPLEKRPMVLKPRRPPMGDFVSGPPSRRVRSEPLRPDE